MVVGHQCFNLENHISYNTTEQISYRHLVKKNEFKIGFCPVKW